MAAPFLCLAWLGGISPARAQQYHTYSEIGPELLTAEQNYPDICKRYNLGESVQGRYIWALRISDNVTL
ncbi:MAG: M14 family zinc carboxypeptidase, partial [Phycisphaerae bacterium]